MPYYDVTIPLKLKTLTYYHENKEDLKGFAVTVPLREKLYDGVVIGQRSDKPEGVKDVKKIETIWGQIYSKSFIDLLLWMSFYYITETGTVLRLTFFEEMMSYLRNKKKHKRLESEDKNQRERNFLDDLSINHDTYLKIINSVKRREYKTFLVQSPNIPYEMKLMTEIAKDLFYSDEIILLILPEIREVRELYLFLRDKLGESVVMLHSRMKASERHSVIERILEDKAKVIVGTRFALFVPIKKLSLIMLSQESSWLYKAEESPRYNARDIAVMRGFFERCPVVLCDSLPSVTSYWNSIRGKFEFINDFSQYSHPNLIIVKQPHAGIFHPEVLLYLRLYEKQGILIITPRTGFSLLKCAECGEVLKCEKCSYSLIYYKDNKTIECNRCNLIANTPDSCPYCGGIEIHPTGVGVERLWRELEGIFSKRGLTIKNYNFENEEIQGIFIGQTGKIKKSYTTHFKGMVFIDFDFFLSIPDYRALENAFGKVISLSHLVKNDGNIFIQTRNSESEIFKLLRSYNFEEFYKSELKHRKEAIYPPFARLIKLFIKIKRNASEDVVERIENFLKSNIQAEIIGPLKTLNKEEVLFIIRSKDKRKLTEELNFSVDKIKSFRGISFKIEVDPVTLKV